MPLVPSVKSIKTGCWESLGGSWPAKKSPQRKARLLIKDISTGAEVAFSVAEYGGVVSLDLLDEVFA